MTRTMIVALLATAALPGVARAQASASAFTFATRYDAERRVVGTIAPDPDGTGPLHYLAVRNTYDAAGRLTKIERGELANWQSELVAPSAWTGFTVNQTVDTTYDTLDRKLTEKISGAGTDLPLKQYSYDSAGRLACTATRMSLSAALPTSACTLQTPNGSDNDRITKNEYDAAGQLMQVRKAVGTGLEQAYVTYQYTPNGKRSAVVDANGNRANLHYDGFDRQDEWRFPSTMAPASYAPSNAAAAIAAAGQVSTTDYETYGYDANGNRNSWRKRDGRQFTFAFDALNRMTLKAVPDGCNTVGPSICLGADRTRDVAYSYDLSGHQTAARFTDANGADAVLTNYNGFGEISSTTTAMYGQSRTLGFGYDADGNRTGIMHPDNNSFTYAYDGLDRLTTTLQAWNGGQITGRTYDVAGRLSTNLNGYEAFGYDGADRMIGLNIIDPTGSGKSVSYSLYQNAAGQLKSQDSNNDAYVYTGAVSQTQSYGVNGLNQYASVGGASFTYDANGNLTNDGTGSYVYDAENRLITGGSSPAYLYYDPLGRLWQTSTGQTDIRQFLYDGDKLSVEYDGSGNLLRRYVHATGEDTPEAIYEGAGTGALKLLLADRQGSIVGTYGVGAGTFAVNRYDEYGMPGASNVGRFGYTGQAWLPELGMWHYKARVYSSKLGRFLQTDPVGYDDQVNLYAYVANDPVNGRDPTGMYECAQGNDCTKFESYRQALITARDSYNAKSTEYNSINASLQKIGDPGVKGMTIAEGGVNTSNPSVSATMDGRTSTMTVYTPTLEKLAKMQANDPVKQGASIIGHEANPDHMRPMSSRADRLSNEVGGYTTQEAVSRALGVSDSTQRGAASTYGADAATRIQNNAINSVNAACKGSQHPTCM